MQNNKLNNNMKLLASIIIIGAGIISFYLMREEKSSLLEGQIDESPLKGKMAWYVFILALAAPVISPTIFYYGWRKHLPKKARKANNLGWLAFLIWIPILWILLMRDFGV